ncbi:MAG: RNA methyltransferase [Caldilineaceae bacterium]
MTTPTHFGIGIYHGKTWENVGILWRSAYQLGAATFSPWARYRKQSTDTAKTWLHIPLFQFPSFEDLHSVGPHAAPIVAIEAGGTPLPEFAHPDRAIYLLGAEDGGLPNHVLDRCHCRVSIPAVRKESYNVAVAGTLVMYDRMIKMSQNR